LQSPFIYINNFFQDLNMFHDAFDNKGVEFYIYLFHPKKTWNPPCFNISKKLVGFGFQQTNKLLKLYNLKKVMSKKNTNIEKHL
jgi:hypothetical protein